MKAHIFCMDCKKLIEVNLNPNDEIYICPWCSYNQYLDTEILEAYILADSIMYPLGFELIDGFIRTYRFTGNIYIKIEWNFGIETPIEAMEYILEWVGKEYYQEGVAHVQDKIKTTLGI